MGEGGEGEWGGGRGGMGEGGEGEWGRGERGNGGRGRGERGKGGMGEGEGERVCSATIGGGLVWLEFKLAIAIHVS
jgi:hypothetical protein